MRSWRNALEEARRRYGDDAGIIAQVAADMEDYVGIVDQVDQETRSVSASQRDSEAG